MSIVEGIALSLIIFTIAIVIPSAVMLSWHKALKRRKDSGYKPDK